MSQRAPARLQLEPYPLHSEDDCSGLWARSMPLDAQDEMKIVVASRPRPLGFFSPRGFSLVNLKRSLKLCGEPKLTTRFTNDTEPLV